MKSVNVGDSLSLQVRLFAGEPLAFEVDAEQVALKQRVMALLGPIVAASAEQKG